MGLIFFCSQKVARFTAARWSGFPVKSFNAGNLRRQTGAMWIVVPTCSTKFCAVSIKYLWWGERRFLFWCSNDSIGSWLIDCLTPPSRHVNAPGRQLQRLGGILSSAESATKMREQIADECMHEDPPRAVGAGRKRHQAAKRRAGGWCLIAWFYKSGTAAILGKNR